MDPKPEALPTQRNAPGDAGQAQPKRRGIGASPGVAANGSLSSRADAPAPTSVFITLIKRRMMAIAY